MAGRRYARDNRGRFAAAGAGATARGGRLATASGKKRATQTKTIASGKPAGTVSKPKGLKPQSAIKTAPASNPAAKPAQKAGTSLQAVNARRARASAPRTSTYLSQKLNTQSAITRSAANAIYNRQRAVSKAGGLDKSVVSNPIGIMPKTSGSVRNRAAQVREAARKRVVGGRRR